MTQANVTGIFETIALSKIRSGPPIAIWIKPRAFAIGTASPSAFHGRGPRVMAGASVHVLLVFSMSLCYLLFFYASPGPLTPLPLNRMY